MRSPSDAVRRPLDLVAPAGVTVVDDPGAPEGDDELHRSVEAGRSAGSMGPEVVDGSLRLVVALARALVGGADGASVSLRRNDRLATVAASDDTVLAMDADQYATGEGPCVDASTVGQRYHTDSLATEARWPAFAPRARALGINAIVSSPLLVHDRPVGALNIYSRTAEAFTTADQDLASLFAAEASTMLSSAEPPTGVVGRASWFAGALEARQVIALAQGVLMERDGLGEAQAYRSLREFSTRTSRPLRERAEDIVASAHTAAPRRTTSPEEFHG